MSNPRPFQPVLSDETLALVARRFRALADPTRLRILNTLMRGELSVGELVERTGIDQPNVSRHLAVLRNEGILARRAEGNRGFYSVGDSTAVELCEIVCAGLIHRLAEDLEGLEDARHWRGSGI